jgi:hypothetical protein
MSKTVYSFVICITVGQRLLVSIFVLQLEIQMYDTYQRRVAECDQELQKHLRAFVDN